MPLQVGEEVEQGRGEEDTGAIFLRTAKEDNGSGQINKWGFAPGEDGHSRPQYGVQRCSF